MVRFQSESSLHSNSFGFPRTESHYVVLAVLKLTLCRPGWPQTYKELPASASGLKDGIQLFLLPYQMFQVIGRNDLSLGEDIHI